VSVRASIVAKLKVAAERLQRPFTPTHCWRGRSSLDRLIMNNWL
jgi:hypothetical protein